MKRTILILALALLGSAWAQSLGAAQRSSITAHINEMAGHLGLLKIDCPAGPTPVLPSEPFLCFTQAFSDADLFRMSWDLYNDNLFVANPTTAVAPWALDGTTGAAHRSFSLAGVGTFAVVYSLEGTTGHIRVGVAPR